MMETVLELNNLTKYFGSKCVVSDISLKINAGEVFGFLGPNGSGKTTTIKMITGLLSADAGSIKICGHDVKTDFEAAMANLGGIVENPDMYKELTGRCNLEMAARVHGNVSKERIEEVIQTVGLQNRINDKVKKYSLGMKQRLGVAQALLHKPKFFVFDEPTNGLDPKGIKEFRDTVKRVAHEEGAAVFVSSHMMFEMEQMCDRVAIIENGRLIDIKDVADVVEGVQSSLYKFVVSEREKTAALIQDTYGDVIKEITDSHFANNTAVSVVLAIDAEQVPQFIKLLAENGINMYSVQPIESSLEDAFINITGGSKIE